MNRRAGLLLPAVAVASLILAGCTALAAGQGGAGGGAATGVQVLASFYPLQYVAQQVGGDLVHVSSLTPPGAEPHDVELSPRQVRSVGEADLVVYLSGFQSAVDQAIAARRPAHVVDAAKVADLVAWPDGQHAGSALDPHFWLDPHRLARLAAPVAAALAAADPGHADTYTANGAALAASLGSLDAEFQAGLATCERHVVITSHEAFGYLADRYHLKQVGISGLDPEAEPSPARLKEIRALVRADGVTTIFSERLVNPKVAKTLASDLNVTAAVLDPVESLVDPSSDYRDVMRKNLVVLRAALGCT
ncbi:MAG TPA: metal ABC transporter substrate-binding protein [Pengzhenrongella sp.]